MQESEHSFVFVFVFSLHFSHNGAGVRVGGEIIILGMFSKMWLSGRLFPAVAFCHKVHIDGAALYAWGKGSEMDSSAEVSLGHPNSPSGIFLLKRREQVIHRREMILHGTTTEIIDQTAVFPS